MIVHHICFPVTSLGPGKRLAIWVSGCPRACPGCITPELQNPHNGKDISVKSLAHFIEPYLATADGITISGGEPFATFQRADLICFNSIIKSLCRDILVYTGFTLSQLPRECLKNITALIDGPYIKEKTTNGTRPYGSFNQSLTVFEKEFNHRYEQWIKSYTPSVQTFPSGKGLYSVGIHKDYLEG